jgi:dTDP-4-dehydrorhamnose reductase
MVIAITGAKGLLGQYLIKTQPKQIFEGVIQANEHEIIELNRWDLDVSDFSKVLNVLFKIQPDLIIHCAANGDVDDVENNSAEAVKTDLLGTINLKDYCEKLNCKLITLSSNAVYSGKSGGYSEDSPRNPINFYGKIKSLADDIIMKSNCDWLIVRPILMYGWSNVRDNWVTRIVRDLKDGKELNLVTDSYTQPTYAKDVAKAIWHLIKLDKWKETYNVSDYLLTTIYDFGIDVCEVFGLHKPLIKTAVLSDFKSIAPRPIDTTFNVKKLSETGFICQGVIEGLTEMKEESK